MTRYFVNWEIDMEAESPEAAARQAHDIQLDPESSATVFYVRDPLGNETLIDLWEEAR